MDTPKDMQSAEALEAIFETDRKFSEETVAQSLGRAAWLSVRSRAEITLTLFDLGIDESKIPSIVEAVEELQDDYLDFIAAGLEGDDEVSRAAHPMEEVVEEVIEELLDTVDIGEGKDIMGSHHFKGGDRNMHDYGEMPDEELIHRLNGHIKRIEADIEADIE